MIHERLYEKLKEVARKKDMIYYSELAELLGMPFETEADRNELFRKIGDISTSEHDQGRPMLSVVVVHKSTSSEIRMPGKGFFKLASDLGVWNKGIKDKFFFDELGKVHEYWSQH